MMYQELTPTEFRILIIDEEDATCWVLATALDAFGTGCTIDVVQTAPDAIERIKQHHPDIILVSEHMHQLRGPDLTKAIRRHSPQAQTVLIISYTAMLPIEGMPADAILSKPFTIEEVSQLIQELRQATEPVLS